MLEDYDRPFLALDAFYDRIRLLVTFGFALTVFLVGYFKLAIPTFGFLHKAWMPVVLTLLILGGFFTRNILSSIIIGAAAAIGAQTVSGGSIEHGGVVIILYLSLTILSGALATPKFVLHQMLIITGLVIADLIAILVFSYMSIDAADRFTGMAVGSPYELTSFGSIKLTVDLILVILGIILCAGLVGGVLGKPGVQLDDDQANKERILGLTWLIIAALVGIVASIAPLNDDFSSSEAGAMLGEEQVRCIQDALGGGGVAIFFGPFTPFYLFMLTGIISAIGGTLYLRGRAYGTEDDVPGGLTAIIFPAFTPMTIILTLYSYPIRNLAGSGAFSLSEGSWIVLITEYAVCLYFAVFLAMLVALVHEFVAPRVEL